MRRKISYSSNQALSDVIPTVSVINIENQVENSIDRRKLLWAGEYSALVAMTIEKDGEVGKEVHPNNDQIISIVSGRARLVTGDSENEMSYERIVDDDFIITVPAGTWHNIINIDNEPLKLISVYAPAEN